MESSQQAIHQLVAVAFRGKPDFRSVGALHDFSDALHYHLPVGLVLVL